MDLHERRLEQILNQFLLKILHVISNSRVPPIVPADHGGAPARKTDKWFSLALGNRPAGIYNPSLQNRNLIEPIAIDVVLIRESPSSEPIETLLERWVVSYDRRRPKAADPHHGGGGDASFKRAYKNSIVLLRSIHLMLKLLPAYKAFRKLNSLRKNCDFDLIYRLSSFHRPFSRIEESAMEKYTFTPIEVHQGNLSVSLSYRRDLSEFNFDSIVSYPPKIIGDYVGSPSTVPVREFPSSPRRPHSWTYGIHKELYSQQSRRYDESPPLYSEYSASANEATIRRSQAYRKGDNFLSPPFSPSPSPPTTNQFHRRLSSETSPMSIPPSRNIIHGRLSHGSSSESTSMRRQDSLRLEGLSSSPANNSQKITKEDSGHFSSLSWGSGRFSFDYDFGGESDFFGPFIVEDDEDPPEKQLTSVNPGALVHMLRTAPPLRQSSSSANYYASDAIEELKAYKELKDVLLISTSNAAKVAREKVESTAVFSHHL